MSDLPNEPISRVEQYLSNIAAALEPPIPRTSTAYRKPTTRRMRLYKRSVTL